MRATQVIGIGNPDRGDDAAGRMVARRLATLRPTLEVLELDGEASALIDCLGRLDAAYLIDACRSGQAAGTVQRLDASQSPLPADMVGWSTHGLGLAAALELARALGSLPRRCVVFAIEGRDFAPGAPLSAPVAAAVEVVAARLAAELMAHAE